MRLRYKVAIVTGTSRPIGTGIAEAFAAEGASVVCVDTDAGRALDGAEAIRRAGGSALGVPCNVTSEVAVKAAIRQAEVEFGHIDILVNGIAGAAIAGIRSMLVEEFRRQVDLALAGTFLFTKHVADQMVKQGGGGSIIHLASTEPSFLNMTRANAVELEPFGIRVNSLVVPVRAAPAPADYAEAIFLASDESELVTGTDIRVDA